MAQPLDFESVDKGSPLEGLSIPALTRVTLARFAGAIDNYNPLHLDDKVAAAAGKNSVFAPAHLIMAHIGRLVEAAFLGASIRRYGLRVLKLLWPGDVLTCRGLVVDKRIEDGEHVLDVDVWADNQRGETVAKGRVLAVVPPAPGKPLPRKSAAKGLVYRLPPSASQRPRASGRKTGTASKKKAARKKKAR